MLKLIASVESVRQTIDRGVPRAARSAPTCRRSLPEAELDELVRGRAVKRYAAGECCSRRATAADGLYLLRRGSVTVSRTIGGREVVLVLRRGRQLRGRDGAALRRRRASATVRAAVATEALVLDGARFKDVLARNPRAARRDRGQRILERITRERRDGIADRHGQPHRVTSSSEGVGEATDMLLIDESLCIRCNNCEKACADTHDGTSRLDREAGPTFAQIHVPTSCRHCEHPHCMKDCPPDAIRRAPDGEVFISDTLHRLRQLRAQLPLRRDPDGAGGSEAAPARRCGNGCCSGLGDEPGLETKHVDTTTASRTRRRP